MGAQTPASAQMSLGKSARQIPPTNLKILKVGGTRQQPVAAAAARYVGQLYVLPEQDQVIKINIPEAQQQVYRIVENYQTSPDIANSAVPRTANTPKDPLNIWGDVCINDDPTQIESSQDFDLLFDNIPFSMLPEKDQDFIDDMWSSDETMEIGDLFEEPPASINSDEMMMVDPRDIEGGMEIEAVKVNENMADDLAAPEVFDLLDFVFTSTVGPEDQTFRSLIDDPDLFAQDEAEQAEIVHNQESMDLLSTIDAGDLDLLSAVNSGQISLLNAVHDDQFAVPLLQIEPALPIVPKQEEVEEAIEIPAKKARGRPRVPRTSSLKPLPR